MPYTINRASIFSFCLLLSLSYIKTKVHFNSLLFTLHFLLLQQHISLTLTFSLSLSFSLTLTMTLSLTLSLVYKRRTFVVTFVQAFLFASAIASSDFDSDFDPCSFSIFFSYSDYDSISDSVLLKRYLLLLKCYFVTFIKILTLTLTFSLSLFLSLDLTLTLSLTLRNDVLQCANIFEHSCHNVTFFNTYVDKL